MKKKTMVILFSTFALGLFSCRKELTGEGPLVTEARYVSDFKGIDLRLPGDVYYRHDASWKVEVIAQKNLIDIIQTRVVDNKLLVEFRTEKDFLDADHIRINVSGPALNSFSLNTAGSIYCMNEIHTSKLALQVNGSGSIILHDVTASDLDAVNTGSGNIKIANGSITRQSLRSSGSGDIMLQGVSSIETTAKTSGSGNIQVKVADRLHATVNGSGSIYYRGYPAVSSHVSGSGHLIHF
jgi:hypothetical protein